MKFFIYFSLISCVVFHISVEELSSLHVRRKRVIDTTRYGGRPIFLFKARYIVNILINGFSHCAGAILHADIIITVPTCVTVIPGVTYTILTNSAYRNGGTPHHIEERSSSPAFDFVVLKIFPPIELHHGLNVKIELFLGEIPLHASAYFSGWGCTNLNEKDENRYPQQLMQTKLPIITEEQCSNFYLHHDLDEGHHFCTYDETERRSACKGDEGGPLVYQNRLLGILLFSSWPPWKHLNIFFNFNNLNIHNQVNFHINELRGVN